MSTRGKDLFEARIEYPLRPKPTPKTKDYIFYFVPATDPYGGGARKFLSKFYSAHVGAQRAESVSSIEEMIGYLHDQVVAGVDHIREVVIVAHANPRGMVVKLLEDASKTRNPEYQYVTFESLAILQKDFAEEKFATFKKKRARVIEHLTDASWVTIRGCRFGQGTEAMYALYAFFGGRANVYAPRHYQFFGSQEIGWKAGEDAKKRGRPIGERPPRKFENRLDAHDHLVRQRFFPKHLHTDERKDAVVRSLADPGMYSETIELASATNPARDSTYAKLIVDLDAKRIPATVTTKLAEADHVLTERAIVEVIGEHRFWKIHDQVKHASVTYPLEYEVWEDPSGGGGHVALQAAARLIVRSTGETLPFQSFFYESENDIWRGKLLTLASYTEDPLANPPFDADEKAAFEKAIAVLDGGRLLSGSTDLTPPFKAENLNVTEAARVTHGSAPAGKGPWTVTEGADSYLVKLEHPVDGHALNVFTNLDARAKNAEQNEIMTWLGNDADTPGPELAAYLDTIATEDLVAIIDHLRDPYRAENSFYIFHCLHALQRKRDYHTFWAQQFEAMPKNEPLPEAPYLDLSRMEYADKDALVYSFRFNEHWAEVKISFPKMPQFTGDLFATEHDLWKKFRKDFNFDRNAPIVEADSPGADIEEARRLAREGNEKYFRDPKATLESAPDNGEVSCEELAALIEKLKELEGMPLDEVEKQLSLTMGPKNKTLWQTFKDVKTLFSILKGLFSAAEFKWIALDATSLAADVIAGKWLNVLKNKLTIEALEKIPWLAPSAIGTPTTIGVALRVFGVVTLTLMPLTVMWKKFLDEQEQAIANWKNAGKIAAVRRYLRELRAWTRTPSFPDHLVIDIDPNDYEDIYFAEVNAFRGGPPQIRWLMYGEDMKEGFIEGLKLMEQVGPELVAKADEAIADSLRQMDFDACKTKVLVDAGVLDIVGLRAEVIRALASRALDEVPGL